MEKEMGGTRRYCSNQKWRTKKQGDGYYSGSKGWAKRQAAGTGLAERKERCDVKETSGNYGLLL